MLNINVGDYNIRNFNNDDKLVEEIRKSSSPYIHNVLDRLLISRNVSELEFSNAYIVYLNDEAIGYIYLSSKNNGYAYLEYMILKSHRGLGLSEDMVNNITEYILYNNQDLKELRLNIDLSNTISQKVANSSGYISEEDIVNDKIDFIISNPYYLRKKL